MMRVLVLDDLEERHLLFGMVLRNAAEEHKVPLEVVRCESAPDAMRALGGRLFDLVLLDCDLGRTDGGGRDVARAMVTLRPTWERLPLVIVHSHNTWDGPGSADELLQAGFMAAWLPFGKGTFQTINSIFRQAGECHAAEQR